MFKVDAKKTEVMVCTRYVRGADMSDRKKYILKQAETFKYLGSLISEKGGCEEYVPNRVGPVWGKWREMSGIVCVNRMPIMLKATI